MMNDPFHSLRPPLLTLSPVPSFSYLFFPPRNDATALLLMQRNLRRNRPLTMLNYMSALTSQASKKGEICWITHSKMQVRVLFAMLLSPHTSSPIRYLEDSSSYEYCSSLYHRWFLAIIYSWGPSFLKDDKSFTVSSLTS